MINVSCPICGFALEPKPAGNLACDCGFLARNLYQVERVRDKIKRAAEIAGRTERIRAMGMEPVVCGKNADGASVLVGYIPADAPKVEARADGSTNFGDVPHGTYALIPVKEDNK